MDTVRSEAIIINFTRLMIKLVAHDKYNKQDIMITIGIDDEMYDTEFYSDNYGLFHKQIIKFEALEGDKDSCNPKRWSDLENITLL